MYKWFEALSVAAALGCFACGSVASTEQYPEIGRVASASDLSAWDTNIRDDFQGLLRGSGSVAEGKALYEVQCLSCHGATGVESIVFSPLVGGTTANDMSTGIVAAFEPPITVVPSTFMRLPTLATLMDYMSRAMPWDAPKSLGVDDVYALTAYLLHLAGIVESDFILSEKNVSVAQGKLPNRKGLQTEHGLWPGAEASLGGMGNGLQPDITPNRCMTECDPSSEQ